ncbi:hypothetical protein T265_09334 [Opisthorchis viverrini]|uniref:Uncharacterized protein n=1 Tax=Opisthorchis viverrini TaxID=6198 RepID=A0A074Z6D6_OPIVI|nr:hypothetical protein T265_09334 [Opisthorchis viverrini]KER22633.1 hypothetical protein T265_09334 [Opisthorchis viverrini]
MLTENQTSVDVEEVPCPDAVPHTCHRITERLCSCVIQHLHRQCAKILAGSWSSAENVVIEKLRFGQPGSIPALVPPCGMAARHRKGATAEQL